jgi:hypothetical protein
VTISPAGPCTTSATTKATATLATDATATAGLATAATTTRAATAVPALAAATLTNAATATFAATLASARPTTFASAATATRAARHFAALSAAISSDWSAQLLMPRYSPREHAVFAQQSDTYVLRVLQVLHPHSLVVRRVNCARSSQHGSFDGQKLREVEARRRNLALRTHVLADLQGPVVEAVCVLHEFGNFTSLAAHFCQELDVRRCHLAQIIQHERHIDVVLPVPAHALLESIAHEFARLGKATQSRRCSGDPLYRPQICVS